MSSNNNSLVTAKSQVSSVSSVQQALAELDKILEMALTTNRLAEIFLEYKCKGDRGAGSNCPLAVFLRAIFPNGRWHILPTKILSGYKISHPLPELARKFIDEFDAGKFPKLKARQWRM